MARTDNLDHFLTDVASAIKTKKGSQTAIPASNFDTSELTNVNNAFSNCTKLDNNTLNQILKLCINATSYTGTKKLATLGIDNTFDNFDNIPNLSNYQDFIDAGWTIS